MGWQVQPPPTSIGILPSLAVPTTVVQAATPAAGTSPVSVSFAHNITVNNSVIVAVVVASATGASVAPASGPDTYTLDSNLVMSGAANHGQFFHKSNSAGGYSSVTATLAATNLVVYAYEVTGAVAFDTATSAASGSASFSDTLTPATSAEFLAGLASATATATLSTPPAAPWVNQSVLTIGAISSVGSYQFVSSASTVTYSGTWSAGAGSGAAIGAYKLTNPGGTVPANECILYYFGGSLYALGPSGNPVLLATT